MILDATAGKRMMWYQKNHEGTIYFDKRKDRHPTVVGDFQKLPFRGEIFDLVVFDPPHASVGHQIFYEQFGSLRASKVVPVLYRASRELFRVLKKRHLLIFKWNTHDTEIENAITLFPYKPLFGQRSAYKTKHSSQTWWITFLKEETSKRDDSKNVQDG